MTHDASTAAGTPQMRNRTGGTVTVLVPCFNEQESLPALFKRLDALLATTVDGPDGAHVTFDALFVDDGSTDSTRSLLRGYAAGRDDVRYVFLSRNFGKEQAMLAGIDAARGDALAIIDADLQDPPELIPDMVRLWLQGYDDVYARRRSRKGESWLKRMTSKLYYRLLQSVSAVPIQPDTGDFRLLDRTCVEALRGLRETDRNSKALFSWIGFRKIEFLYDRDARAAGRSKWHYPQLVALALDGITSFTTSPLRIATYTGALVSFGAIGYAIYIVLRTLFNGPDVPGYASLLVFMLMLGGIELLCLGVIGEYLGRVFNQTKARPNYLVEETSPMPDRMPAKTGSFDGTPSGGTSSVSCGRPDGDTASVRGGGIPMSVPFPLPGVLTVRL